MTPIQQCHPLTAREAMRALLRQIHAHCDRAVAYTCAAGLAFVVLVLPQITDQQPAPTAFNQATRP